MHSANDASASRHRSDPTVLKTSKQQRPNNSTTSAFWPRKKQKPNTDDRQRLSTASTAIESLDTGQTSPHGRESDVEALRNDIRAGALLAELFSGDETKVLKSVLETQPLLGQFLSKGLGRKAADTGSSLAQNFPGRKDQEAEQTGRLQLQTRPKTDLSQDPVTTRQINGFVRRHKFVTEQCFEQYSTAQPRAFEKDVYDYARDLKLRKQAAKVAVREARKMCGEVNYDSDESRLDEDEVDDSESGVAGLPSLIPPKPLTLPAASQAPSDADDGTTQAVNQTKRKHDTAEDQSKKKRKLDEGPALQEQTTEHDNSENTAGNALTATEAKADGTVGLIASITAESSKDGAEDQAQAGRAERNCGVDGAAAQKKDDKSSHNQAAKSLHSNSQLGSNNHPQDDANGHATTIETRKRTEEKTGKVIDKPQKSVEELRKVLQKNLVSVRKTSKELDLVLEQVKGREMNAMDLQNIKKGIKCGDVRKEDLLQTVDDLIAADPSLGSNESPSSTAWRTLTKDLAQKRQDSWNSGPNSQLDLINQARMENEEEKNLVQLLTALNEKKQSSNNWTAEQLLLAYENGSVTIQGFGSILTAMRKNSPIDIGAFTDINQAHVCIAGSMGIVEGVEARRLATNTSESDDSDDGMDEEEEGVEEEDKRVDEGGEGSDEDGDNRRIKSEEGHGNHNTVVQGQNNHAEASKPVLPKQPQAPISNNVETVPAKSDDELLRLYRNGEMDWRDGLRILSRRFSDTKGQMSFLAMDIQNMLRKISSYTGSRPFDPQRACSRKSIKSVNAMIKERMKGQEADKENLPNSGFR